MRQGFGGQGLAIGLDSLASEVRLGLGAVATHLVGRLDEGPTQVFVAVLAVAFPLDLVVGESLGGYQPAIGDVVSRGPKAGDGTGLQGDDHAERLTDAWHGEQEVVRGGGADVGECRFLQLDDQRLQVPDVGDRRLGGQDKMRVAEHAVDVFFIESLDGVAVDGLPQVAVDQALEAEDVLGALPHKLQTLAQQVAQLSRLVLDDMPLISRKSYVGGVYSLSEFVNTFVPSACDISAGNGVNKN